MYIYRTVPQRGDLCTEDILNNFYKSSKYDLDSRGVGFRVPVGTRFFSSPRRPDQFWGPPSLLSNGYRGLYPL
jgi:hypothetical protein